MKELLDEACSLFEGFKKDAEKAANGNKAAGARARKASLAIEKKMKEFRKLSLAKD